MQDCSTAHARLLSSAHPGCWEVLASRCFIATPQPQQVADGHMAAKHTQPSCLRCLSPRVYLAQQMLADGDEGAAVDPNDPNYDSGACF